MKKLVAFALVACAALAIPALAAEKPRIAVLEFSNKADNQWWGSGGAAAAQDIFVTELVKGGKFRVIDREQLSAILREKNLSLSGDVDASTAVKAGKLLGVKYLLVGAVTEYGNTRAGGGARGIYVGKNTFVAAMNARIIDVQTGEIIWADEGRGEEATTKVSVFGAGGGTEDDRMFDKVLKPIIRELVASLNQADL